MSRPFAIKIYQNGFNSTVANNFLKLSVSLAGALVMAGMSIQVMNLFVVFKYEGIASKILLLSSRSRALSP